MPCSIFEDDETVIGWKAGSSVAYCEPCFKEVMEESELKTVNVVDDDSDESREDTVPEKQEERPSTKKKSVNGDKRKRKQMAESDDDDEVEEDESDGDSKTSRKLFFKKAKGNKKKKPGRKAKWCPRVLDDLIDIIVSSNSYKKKLIFTNTKNQRNGELYGEILKEVKARASARGENFNFSVNQLRSKFKKCVCVCKQAALTQKTATGIKRFQEDQGFGKWFTALFEVVKTRESCQPDLALEPSASPSPSDLSGECVDDSAKEKELFVPVKAKRRQSSKERLDTATIEALTLVKEAVQNDPTKELISFMKEEMEKSRQHELKLFQLLLNQRSEASFHSIPYSSNEHRYNANFSPYPSWHSGAQAIPSHPGSSMPEWSPGAPYQDAMGLDQSCVATPKYTRL